MTVCNTIDRCIEIFTDNQLLEQSFPHKSAVPCAPVKAADLLEVRESTAHFLSDNQILAAIRAKQRCSVAGCNRTTMPLTSVCKYHLAGSNAAAFGSCSYPGCTAPVANMKMLNIEYDALCPLHANTTLLQNSDERRQNATMFFQKQQHFGNCQLDALVMNTCDELIRHYAKDRDLFSVSSVHPDCPETNVCCNEIATQIVPISGTHAVACTKSMVDQILYMCASIQMEK